ncbi:hypothetical protein LJC04_04545 [Ruminococcaceae bacterium OttesenSCG-928-O06]|nr:hypothetical protein [Ruminococcaceae bacterium OttesenSCG-928-O06]
MNKGLKNKQQSSRDETIEKIKEAVECLRENMVPITKKSISDEAEISYRVMFKPHVEAYLYTLPEFNPSLVEFSELHAKKIAEAEVTKLQNKIIKHEKTISFLSQKRIYLENENKHLKEELNILKDKYGRLLGKYQTEISSNLIKL